MPAPPHLLCDSTVAESKISTFETLDSKVSSLRVSGHTKGAVVLASFWLVIELDRLRHLRVSRDVLRVILLVGNLGRCAGVRRLRLKRGDDFAHGDIDQVAIVSHHVMIVGIAGVYNAREVRAVAIDGRTVGLGAVRSRWCNSLREPLLRCEVGLYLSGIGQVEVGVAIFLVVLRNGIQRRKRHAPHARHRAPWTSHCFG